MASIQELSNEVMSIKQTSDQLAQMVGAANTSLASQSSMISNMVQGSQSGQEAVMSLSVATRSLADAASAMKALSRTCDECIANLDK